MQQGPVRVDLSSAVVAYRPADGEERVIAAQDLKPAALSVDFRVEPDGEGTRANLDLEAIPVPLVIELNST